MKTNEIIIRINKVKVIGLIGLCLIFVLAGIWISFYAPIVEIEFLNNAIFRKAIGFLSIIYFGFMGLLITQKLFESQYGLRIDEQGIYDNSSIVNAGLIKWENIEEIEKSKYTNQKFIRIKVNNPDYFVNRQKNFLARKGLVTNFKKYGSPIQISANTLNIRFEELFLLFKNELEKRK